MLFRSPLLRDVDTCCFVQVFKIVHTCAFVHMLRDADTCCFVQVFKVVHTCAFVHMLRDVDTCCFVQVFRVVLTLVVLFKRLRSSIHVCLYTCLGTWTLVVCSSV